MRDRRPDISMLEDTLKILEQGWYEKDGRKISLKLSAAEMKNIRVYLPEEVGDICSRTDFEPSVKEDGECRYSCENCDSYVLARKLTAQLGQKVLVLNLASPVHPGGGVRRGARAQEEDLCRKSSLLLSLESDAARKYYRYNESLHSLMGSDALMLTPDVEIIKDADGSTLDDTVIVSVLTCAAPKVSAGKEGMTEAEYRDMVCGRIAGMLRCAAFFGYRYLVLGAWGCGAYGNDARVISDLFSKVLRELEFSGHGVNELFSRIDFAVLDRTPEQYNYKEFSRNFGR